MTTAPSVRTPSTSRRISLMREALSSRFRVPGSWFKVLSVSEEFSAPEVVEVHDSGDTARVLIDDDDRRDLAGFHDVESLDGERRRRNRHRTSRHDVGGRQPANVDAALHLPPQVA